MRCWSSAEIVGETPGYPRVRPTARWKQLEFTHGNRALKFDAAQKRVRIPGVGTVPLRKGREISAFGRAFVVEKNGRWWAIFECKREPMALPGTGTTFGIDRGVHVLAATSDGELIRNGRFANRHRRVLGGHARALAAVMKRDASGRCVNRRDPKRIAAVRRLARAKEREANARLDALHKAAHRNVALADAIALEALNVRAMTRSAKGTLDKPGRNVAAKTGLNRATLDAGFTILRRLIGEKAACAVRQVIDVEAIFVANMWALLHVAATAHLDLKDVIHVGHATGGGEVVRYLARHGEKNVKKAALISAVPPLTVRTRIPADVQKKCSTD